MAITLKSHASLLDSAKALIDESEKLNFKKSRLLGFINDEVSTYIMDRIIYDCNAKDIMRILATQQLKIVDARLTEINGPAE